jgi:hypothetical protein
VLANDRPTVGELLADGDAVSGETFFEASRSQRLAMVRWPTTSATTTLPSQPTCTPSERTA